MIFKFYYLENLLKIYQQYIASQFFIPFILCSLFFISFLLTVELLKVISLLVGKGVDWKILLELIGHISLSFLSVIIPISCFFASYFIFNKMSDDREVMALRSFGTRDQDLFVSLLPITIMIMVMIFYLVVDVIPYSKRSFKKIIFELTSQEILKDIGEKQFFTKIPNTVLFAQKIRGGFELEKVFIYIHDKKTGIKNTILARKGVFLKDDFKVNWRSNNIRLVLTDGNILREGRETFGGEKIIFEKYDFLIFPWKISSSFFDKDEMKNSRDLWHSIQEKQKRLKVGDKHLLKKINKAIFKYFARINRVIECCLFIIVGALIGMSHMHKRTGGGTFYAIGFIFSYYIIFFIGMALVKKDLVPVIPSVFFASFLTIVLIIFLYRKNSILR